MRIIEIMAGGLLLLAGCATAQAPAELVSARSTYARVSAGPAATVVPDELHKARVALDTAERSFSDDPESAITRDLSYIAERKAQLAEARGELEVAGKDRARADQQFKLTLVDQRDQATGAAARSQRQAAQSEDHRRRDAEQHDVEIQDARARTDAEAAARVTAEAKTRSLTADLALLGQLREDERGTAITLSGDVIFVTGEATLLASAQTRLDRLADVIKPGDHRLIIEGHTDSRGSDALNQGLSQRRATAVRDYLVSRGVDGERIQVNGFGKTRPIGDNGSAEGRAMNRRVEIIVAGLRGSTK